MEPIVPKPEERISGNNQGQKRPRHHHPDPAEYEQAARWGFLPTKFSLPSALILLFAIFMVILFGMQQQSISRLEEQLARLDTTGISPDNNTQADDGNENGPPEQSIIPGVDNSKAMGELTKQINFLWKTLESHTGELAALRTKVKTPASGPDKGEAGTLQESSAAIKAVQDDLSALTKRLDATEKALGGNSDKQQAWQLSQGKNIDSLNQKIASLEAQVSQRVDGVSKAVKDSLGATTVQLQKEFKSALDQTSARQAQALSSLEKQFQQQKLENGKLQQAQIALGKQVQGVDQQVQASLNKAMADVKSQVGTSNANHSKRIEAQGERIDSLSRSLDEQKSQTEQLRKAQVQLATRVGQIDKGWQTALNTTKTDLRSSQSDLQTRFSATQSKLTALETKMTSASRTSTAAASTVGNDSAVVEVRKEIAALSARLDSSLTAVKTQEASLRQWRSQVDQQLSKALTSGSTPAAATSSNSALQELRAQLASQAATLKQLQEKDSQLVRDISASKAQLLGIQGNIAKLQPSGASGGASSKPGTDLTSVENQIADLAVKIDSTQSKVSAYESQMASWQKKMENDLASGPASSGGATQQDIATIKAIIKLLMGHHPYTDFPPLK